MAKANLIERLGKLVFEAPFRGSKIAKDAPELAEIRLAILDAVREKAHRAGGKLVFPYNAIRVYLLGVPADQSEALQSNFLAEYLSGEVCDGLKRSGYRFPPNLAIKISTTENMPGPEESWLRIEASLEEEHSARVEEVSQTLALAVVTGSAEPKALVLTKPYVNIGRTREAAQNNGPTRCNDIAFLEEDDAGRSVSRQHAHIERDKNGKCRLFNDRIYKGEKNCGLYLVRQGVSHPVHRGGHGAILEPGDQIHMAQAVVRVDAAG